VRRPDPGVSLQRSRPVRRSAGRRRRASSHMLSFWAIHRGSYPIDTTDLATGSQYRTTMRMMLSHFVIQIQELSKFVKHEHPRLADWRAGETPHTVASSKRHDDAHHEVDRRPDQHAEPSSGQAGPALYERAMSSRS
jgi:hypothetical protein